MAAMAEARRLRCPLMVAKLDRLSRDTHFVTGAAQFNLARPSSSLA
jgi:hypothetical protein